MWPIIESAIFTKISLFFYSPSLSNTGVRLQSLMGNIQFVNVSFHYPSRTTVCLISYCVPFKFVCYNVIILVMHVTTLKVQLYKELIGLWFSAMPSGTHSQSSKPFYTSKGSGCNCKYVMIYLPLAFGKRWMD